MGAFVANHKAVSTINNFVAKKDVEYYTKIQGLATEPPLPPILLESFHKFVIQPNIHPVRICLNLQQFGIVSEHYTTIKKVLDLMTEREMKRSSDVNELMAFKYHYLAWTVKEIISCRDHFLARNQSKEQDKDSKSDYLEMFIKRVLKPNKDGQQDYMELTIRECVREFPFRECTIFQQVVRQLASKENNLSALEVLKQSINGQRGFQDLNSFCSTCGDEKPDKKCSKCKQVQYCDRECQRLHWWLHKKECARLSSAPAQAAPVAPNENRNIDQAELSEELQKLVAG
jgi:ankyrin repeat and MYND domain-containing protein 2